MRLRIAFTYWRTTHQLSGDDALTLRIAVVVLAVIITQASSAGERRQCSKYKQQAANKLYGGNEHSVQLWKRNVRFNQLLAHLFSSLRNKKLAASGKKKQQTNSYPRQENSEPFPRMQLTEKNPKARH